MKALTIALTFSLLSSAVFARPRPPRPPHRPHDSTISEMTLANSTIQTVAYAVANALAVSSMATTDATSNNRKVEAVMIQNDIQDYTQSGAISPLLADKMALVNSINDDLSEEEAIDALVIATDLILN